MSLLSNLETKEIILKNKPHTSSFIFRHLPADMGVVIGNYLRQFLMKYTSGITLLGAKIIDREGSIKKVEFSTLSGVLQTTPYFIINLKNIMVEQKKKKEGIFCLELNIENKEKKEKIIKAGDFQGKDIEIKNPDHYLATLSAASDGQENPKLEVKLFFQKNWGYHEVKNQKQEEEIKKMIKKYFPNDEDIITFDADYSPVKQVSFEEKEVTIDSGKKEEELIITVTTNGTVKPEDALQEVLELSKDSFNFISNSLTNNKKKEKAMKEEVKI